MLLSDFCFFGFIGYIAHQFSNFGAGTLGGLDFRRFPVNKYELQVAVNSLAKIDSSPQIPAKWKEMDHWEKGGVHK